jgi:hypothetical protein
MGRVRRVLAGQPDPVKEALSPRGCGRCGLTFGSAASWQVHFEDGPETSRCLPPGAFGQLIERDGIWVLPWSDAAKR